VRESAVAGRCRPIERERPARCPLGGNGRGGFGLYSGVPPSTRARSAATGPPPRPGRVAARITSASINGTLDVTRTGRISRQPARACLRRVLRPAVSRRRRRDSVAASLCRGRSKWEGIRRGEFTVDFSSGDRESAASPSADRDERFEIYARDLALASG